MSVLLILFHAALTWELLPRLGLGHAAWAPLSLAALVLIPGWFWSRAFDREDRGCLDAPQTIAWGVTHLLLCVYLFSLVGWSLGTGLKALSLLVLVPVWFARHHRARVDFRAPNDLLAWLVVLSVIATGLVMAAVPAGIELSSDAPAHLGAIVDAQHSDTWIPPDLSFPGSEGRPDPRFGLAHGLYAAISQMIGVHPREVFRTLPIIVAPLLLLIRYWFFIAIGAPRGLALAAAILFVLSDGDGRGYSLWSSPYPGHTALGLAILAMTLLMQEWALSRRRNAVSIGAILLLALSARVHPFGWWIVVSTLGVTSLLWWAGSNTRARAQRALLDTMGAAALGATVLVPLLLNKGESPLHGVPTDVMFVGGGLFVIDPLSFARWSSTSTLFALPVSVWLATRLRDNAQRQLLAAAAIVVVFFSFFPLITTIAWSTFSYLLVRTGRILPATLVLLWGLWIATKDLRRRHAVAASLALALLCTLGLMQELRAVRWLVRGPSPSREAAIEATLDEIADSEWATQFGIPLASPRVAYGLRARLGGQAWAIPVAHTSPADAGVRERLDLLRSVYSPWSSWPTFRQALAATEAKALLVVFDLSRFEDHAYVTDPAWEQALEQGLREAGVPTIDEGAQWTLFDVTALPDSGWTRTADFELESLPPDVQRLDPPLIAYGFEVVGWTLDARSLPPGSHFDANLFYRELSPNGSTWPSLQLYFDGPQPALPTALRAFAKPLRKIFLERRGKSQARWGRRWTPYDGGVDLSAHPSQLLREAIRIDIPSYARSGTYRISLEATDRPWRVQRNWRDYLSDDRSGAVAIDDSVQVVGTHALRPPSAPVSGRQDSVER